MDRPQVKFPPPALYLGMVVLGYGLDQWLPWHWPAGFVSVWLGVALVGTGAILIGWAAYRFRHHQTTILPHKASSRIIQDGPFQLSRNPIYLAMTLIQVGIGIGLGNVWILALVYPTLRIMNQHVIDREEAFLKHAFGDEYLAYCKTVRRWI